MDYGFELVKDAWFKSKKGRHYFFKAMILLLLLNFLLKPAEYISPWATYITGTFFSFSAYVGLLYASKKLDQDNTFEMKDLFSFWETKHLKLLFLCFFCYIILQVTLGQFVSYLELSFIKMSQQPLAIFTSLMSHFSLPFCLIFVLVPFVMLEQGLTFKQAINKVLSSIWSNIFVYSISVIILTSLPAVLVQQVFSTLGTNFPMEYFLLLVFVTGILFYYLNAVASYLLFAYYKKYL